MASRNLADVPNGIFFTDFIVEDPFLVVQGEETLIRSDLGGDAFQSTETMVIGSTIPIVVSVEKKET